MVRRSWAWAALLGLTVPVYAEEQEVAGLEPLKLTTFQPANQSVYELPAPPTEKEGVNAGGINLDMKVSYFSDYIYRGVDVPNFVGEQTREQATDQANFQFDGRLAFNLDKLPHPFIGIFANVLDSDPVTNFLEVRPFFGAEWRIRPLILAAGNNTYVYPDRSELSTGEVWAKITLDDAAILRRDEPLLSPYLYGAYDYDLYNGWYFEAGVSHDFVIEGTPITITALADVAYVYQHGLFVGRTGEDTGFQHYELGLIGRYSLNTLLNIPQRYGQWSLNGYLFYTDGIDEELRAETKLYGGGGIQLTY